MRLIKFGTLLTFVIFLTFGSLTLDSIAEEEPDCTHIKNDTLTGNLKYFMCKRKSDKIDKDGNFKEGLFNIFKKKS